MEKTICLEASKKPGSLAAGHFLLVLAGSVLSLAIFVAMLLLLPISSDHSALPGYLWTLLRDPAASPPILLSAGVASLFFIAWVAFLSVRHLRPIRRLCRTIDTVIGGDYAAKLRVSSHPEWHDLCDRFNLMVKTFRKKIAVEKYVSKSTAQMVESLKTGEFSTAPHRQDLTIFFSDIRGFTPYTEDHDPMDVVNTVNEIFNIQVDLINKYQGDIDKYIGDAIMAVFADPSYAFKAAWDIQKRLAIFNQDRQDKLHIGIGIHSGTAVVGPIGSRDSLNWTVMGDVVNTAERLCSSCPGGQIYVSAEADGQFKTRRPGRRESLKLKGRRSSSEVMIYRSEPVEAED